MELREHVEAEITVFRLIGTLQSENDAMLMRERISACVAKHRRRIVFDLEDLTYINSWGLGLLVALLTMLRREGGDLRLARLGHHVHNLFIVTQLSNAFQTYGGVQDAVKSFR